MLTNLFSAGLRRWRSWLKPEPAKPPPLPPPLPKKPLTLDQIAKREARWDRQSKWGARTLTIPRVRFRKILRHEIGRKFPPTRRWVHLRIIGEGIAYQYSNPMPPSWLPWNWKPVRKRTSSARRMPKHRARGLPFRY